MIVMQTRKLSLLESFCNVGSGLVISLIFWTLVVVPVWNLPVTFSDNLIITASFTVISMIRGYFWRRAFNFWDTIKSYEVKS